MCSEQQSKSNRQNAQKSTGPKTEEGKKVSSQNAVKHGLNSVNIVINSPHLKEDQKDYDLLVAALIDELEPKSQFQLHFVYKIANAHWRYNRLINAETAHINRQLTPDRTPYSYYNEKYYANLKAHNELDDYLHSRSLPAGDESKILIRYEWRLNRELRHAYQMLRELQARDERLQNKTQMIRPNSSYSPPSSGPAQSAVEGEGSGERSFQKSQNEPRFSPPSTSGKGAGGLGLRFGEKTLKKSQNEPISPKPNASQQPARPTETDEYIDKVLDALQKDQPLPPEPSGLNPLDGFISAMEKKFGLR